jgi:hypothetical protein
VFSESRVAAGFGRVRLGVFDDDPGARPSYHWAVIFKAPWWTIHDDLPQLDEPGT